MIDVDDIALGTIMAANTDTNYEIINLGGGKNPISINTLISNIESLLGKNAILDSQPFHSADVHETWADISKAKSILNWAPKITLEKGLENTVDWYMENKHWLKEIKFI